MSFFSFLLQTESADINSSSLESDIAENVFTCSIDVEGNTTSSPSCFQE